jgi:hypothetical protein
MNWMLKEFAGYNLRYHKGHTYLTHPYCGNTIHTFTSDDLSHDLDMAHEEIIEHKKECVMYA